jgi:hypothetical protein
MNVNDVWNSSRNAPTSMERDALVQHARQTIRRLQRRRVVFLTWTGSALLAVTALAVYVWSTGRADATGAWALSLTLVAQWIAFLHGVRQTLGTAGKPVAPEASIRESLETLRREAENERRGQVAVLVLFAVAAPLMAAAILHLRQIGKMGPSEALSAGALFAGVCAISVTVILVRLFRSILPRRRRLSALLQQYRGD